jgi:hypothetical protein
MVPTAAGSLPGRMFTCRLLPPLLPVPAPCPVQLLTAPPKDLLTSVEEMEDAFWKQTKVGGQQASPRQQLPPVFISSSAPAPAGLACWEEPWPPRAGAPQSWLT